MNFKLKISRKISNLKKLKALNEELKNFKASRVREKNVEGKSVFWGSGLAVESGVALALTIADGVRGSGDNQVVGPPIAVPLMVPFHTLR